MPNQIDVRFLFVGENRSQTAQDKDYTWDNCGDDGVLCAKKLFMALRAAGIEPRDHDFANVWDDRGNPLEVEPEGRVVVAMGQKVQDELLQRGIPFIPIVHPAARGNWCRRDEYTEMIKEIFIPENIDFFRLQ